MRYSDLFVDVSNNVLDEAIETWVKGSRNREIMHKRLIDCVTFEKLAEDFDMSVRQIKNIVYKYEIIIFKHI